MWQDVCVSFSTKKIRPVTKLDKKNIEFEFRSFVKFVMTQFKFDSPKSNLEVLKFTIKVKFDTRKVKNVLLFWHHNVSFEPIMPAFLIVQKHQICDVIYGQDLLQT